MESGSLKKIYSCKTDEELIVLAEERRTLEPEARLFLFDELNRRKLKLPLPAPKPQLREIPPGQNPAFNLPAKIASASLVLAWGGLAIAASIALSGDPEMPYFVLGGALIFGPIFAGIAWATRRALRKRGEPGK